jgi:hypothetical protein
LVERARPGRTVGGVRCLLLSIAVLLAAAAPAGAAWTLPADGPVVGRFHVGADPFAAGQRRGVDLSVAAGARVVAPCAGRIAFAGVVPRFGAAVSVRCGRLTATVLGLSRLAVRAGAAVARGSLVGLARGGRLRLGARVTAKRFGYRDPLALIGDDAPARAPLVGPRPVGRRMAPPAAPRARFVARPAPQHTGSPVLAWVGLALLACALPGGAIAWRVRRSRGPLARARLSRPR